MEIMRLSTKWKKFDRSRLKSVRFLPSFCYLSLRSTCSISWKLCWIKWIINKTFRHFSDYVKQEWMTTHSTNCERKSCFVLKLNWGQMTLTFWLFSKRSVLMCREKDRNSNSCQGKCQIYMRILADSLSFLDFYLCVMWWTVIMQWRHQNCRKIVSASIPFY